MENDKADIDENVLRKFISHDYKNINTHYEAHMLCFLFNVHYFSTRANIQGKFCDKITCAVGRKETRRTADLSEVNNHKHAK